MRQIKLFILFLAFSSLLFAITAKDFPRVSTDENIVSCLPPGPTDPKAKAVIDSIYQRYSQFKSLKVNIVYSTGYQSLISSDTIQGYREGEKYRLIMPHQEVVHDGKKVWFYDRNSGKIHSRSHNPEEFNSMYPIRILKNWESSFQYSIADEWDIGEQSYLRVLFVPKLSTSNPSEFGQFNLFIDKSNFQILRITFSDTDGYLHVLDYRDIEPNVKIKPSLFEFDFS